ncbi:MAG: class III poly(R)-hydroxyalkanoic acid synthase subunit PhaE [Deferrisomatales bacterium]
MNWTQQVQEMTQSWAEAQKKLWEGWSDAAARAPSAETNPWGDWMAQWQKLSRERVDAWTRGAPEVPRQVVDRMLGGEGAFLQFVDLFLGLMKTIAPKVEAGQDWADLIRRYLGQLEQDMAQQPAPWFTPDLAAAAARDLPELWRLYGQELQKLGLPWIRSFGDARGHLGEAMSGDRHASIKMYNLFMDTFQASLGKFTAAPAVGYTREFQEKVTRAFETWVDVRRAEVEFRTELVNVGFRTLEHLVRELVERGEKGHKVQSFRELFDLWVATGERVYFEVASTEGFAQTQSRLVNAAMSYRVQERRLAEEVQKAMHLPTRRELDDAYRHLHELRREVRALRKTVSALEAVPSPGSPPAPRKTGRRGKAKTQTDAKEG